MSSRSYGVNKFLHFINVGLGSIQTVGTWDLQSVGSVVDNVSSLQLMFSFIYCNMHVFVMYILLKLESYYHYIQYRLKICSQQIVCSVRVVRACTFLLVRVKMYTHINT